ncbi:hypothetical protein BHM03_00026234, partial [Ensete ventricosum]
GYFSPEHINKRSIAIGDRLGEARTLMSSLLFVSKPLSAALPYSLSPVFSSAALPSILLLSLSFRLQRRRRCRLKLVRAQDSDAGDTQPPKGSSVCKSVLGFRKVVDYILPSNRKIIRSDFIYIQPKSRRDILLEYVKNVQPEFMELFVKRAPKQVVCQFLRPLLCFLLPLEVVDAMRQTVANMIGTLPHQFFSVTVTTDVSDYAPGTQKKVTGEVIKWNKITGPEKMDAVKYIEFLESEVEELKRQVTRRSANGHNELLDYIKSLEPQNLKVLKIVACLCNFLVPYNFFFCMKFLQYPYPTM